MTSGEALLPGVELPALVEPVEEVLGMLPDTGGMLLLVVEVPVGSGEN